jgi:hypothetical protein
LFSLSFPPACSRTRQQRPQLALIKLTNELLKRVTSPEISGKILLWVANSLPLIDRSGFNQAGTYYASGTLHLPQEFLSLFTCYHVLVGLALLHLSRMTYLVPTSRV